MLKNPFKAALASRKPLIGLWLNMADAYAASMAGQAGFDWLVIDGEHGPNDLRSVLHQLQALESSPSFPVVRLPVGEKWMIKQFLDIGAQTLLIPMVDTREQAEALVRAVRYPPYGERGMGAAVARASRFNTIDDYAQAADREVCLLVQAETRQALENLDAILSVDGVDGVFIGPADLAADMGFAGQLDAEPVQQAIEAALVKITAAGKPAGILTFDENLNKRYLSLGAQFVAVGGDVTEFVTALRRLASRYGRGVGAENGKGY
ncbi:HpcH/HpaI aldolase/citrate lyase family protein [Rhizobium oryzicola]|uniref:HpcH/HpaI aldolase/citrate lyase family protein n=1 Tax=Rhizobium oryzicola TaxID=1232668 RepID=A0ABT8STZ1_9HYPH|nr:HpcH/HpaI aldolase/citrate lyase family protein [Rhizobium oryzicola]MDO1581895.1 HpcH/HpaI aldolase/citrate lyase family protein [Rhizobium oryzicola]